MDNVTMEDIAELEYVKNQVTAAMIYLSKAVDNRGHIRLTLQGLALFAADDIRRLTKENGNLKAKVAELETRLYHPRDAGRWSPDDEWIRWFADTQSIPEGDVEKFIKLYREAENDGR